MATRRKLSLIKEANQILEKRYLGEQATSGIVTPDVVENFFTKKIENALGTWTTIDDLKKLYSLLTPWVGKRVKGVSKCFNAEHQTAGKPIDTTVLSYLNKLNYWQLQNKCSKNYGGPSYMTLVYEIEQVGTTTLGKEGELLKKQLIDLLIKNGAEK